ncbi:GntR family transcriptional regulator [Glaciimonas sp. CA11.2]|uniref:GntR family transcriptional regulator n=1 Tax=unclassified Glaciimonas TaxID=2644401 RepID=UPI002AB3E054|nr:MULTISPECIES: GntR family transcriptional regulator [unclassified Glaciimonas]MDY7546610.1 GntR family transcriptional regulator [Glaciimonas sp. CA11.2]MEB0011736.1 GntR family transcriptional regulator [Glaciimonas sp. Cout2]MEB0080708.1 GntR family transcriptional regulator [Glaciimonas sp. Gout2]MEB0163036.1 GntR family transcriptional regulator [Glaciimonas sp. CA11.2]
MSKPPTIFKKTTNFLLGFIAQNMTVSEVLPSEQYLATVCHASRTVVRSVIAYLDERRLINGLTDRQLIRLPIEDDYFDVSELQSGLERIQQVMMERVFQKDMQPGAEFSEAELAREAGTSTVSIREFLIGFSRFGLIEKKPRGGWRLCAFDLSFARELADMRQMFEVAAVEHFCSLLPTDPAYKELDRLIVKHAQLEPKMKTRYGEFPALDREFHTFLIGLLRNRFAQEFYDIVSFVFHYHYQWDKGEEMQRNSYALKEHLAILHALSERNPEKALDCMRSHLDSSRTSLMKSIRTRG